MSKNLNFDEPGMFPDPITMTYEGKTYTLQPANGDAVRRFRNAKLEAARMGDTGKLASVKGLADAEFVLVSGCLKNDKDQFVGTGTIQGWPYRIQKALYDQIQEWDPIDANEDDKKKQADEAKKLAMRYDDWLSLSHELGMTLRDCMRVHTEKELRVWKAWFKLKLQRPSRSDYYLMQIAAEVRRKDMGKAAKDVKVSDFYLRLEEPKANPNGLSQSDYYKASKAAWLGAGGIKLPT